MAEEYICSFLFLPFLSVGKKKKYSHKKEQITSKGFADVYGPAWQRRKHHIKGVS